MLVSCTKLTKETKKLREKSIEFRWWQALLCGKEHFVIEKTLFVFLFTLSLSLFFLSFSVSVRCCSVQCRAWPLVLFSYKYVIALLLLVLLRYYHLWVHGTVYYLTAWYGQVDRWLTLFTFRTEAVQYKYIYKCFYNTVPAGNLFI